MRFKIIGVIFAVFFAVSGHNIYIYGGEGSMAEAHAFLKEFLSPTADHMAMTQKMRPNKKDYQAYFTEDAWEKAMKTYDGLWTQDPMSIKPNAGQTVLLLWKATVEEIKNDSGDAAAFPGGYKQIIDKIKPGHTIYRFKFVKPGETLGLAFDGLVYLDGRWVIIPKPWLALR